MLESFKEYDAEASMHLAQDFKPGYNDDDILTEHDLRPVVGSFQGSVPTQHVGEPNASGAIPVMILRRVAVPDTYLDTIRPTPRPRNFNELKILGSSLNDNRPSSPKPNLGAKARLRGRPRYNRQRHPRHYARIVPQAIPSQPLPAQSRRPNFETLRAEHQTFILRPETLYLSGDAAKLLLYLKGISPTPRSEWRRKPQNRVSNGPASGPT